MVARRSKRPPRGKIELPTSEYEEALRLGHKIKEQQAFKDLKGFEFQKILFVDRQIGIFTGLCGMLDGLKIDNNGNAIIFDLKTAKTCDPRKYFWHCVEYGYIQQLAVYTMLVRANYPEVKDIECRHLVIEKDGDGINKCQTFIFDNNLIKTEIARVELIINRIAAENNFNPINASWDKAVVIRGRQEEEVEI